MDDKKLAILCIIITLISAGLLLLTYENEFKEKTIAEIIESPETTKGLVFGRVQYVIKNSPTTLFLLTDGNTIQTFYPRETQLSKNDFVYVYAEKRTYEGKEELYAYKVVKEN